VPGARVWATDVSPEALAVARANVAGSGSAVGTRVRLLEGDWWGALPDELRGRVDVVVSNPPYVAGDEDLPPEVEEWEPRAALRAGRTGREAASWSWSWPPTRPSPGPTTPAAPASPRCRWSTTWLVAAGFWWPEREGSSPLAR
jgi:release factor glutamine methyltransferase